MFLKRLQRPPVPHLAEWVKSSGEYLELTEPRITIFILMSTAIGFLCGEHIAVERGAGRCCCNTLLGTGLIASGTAALNQWYERAADAKMVRTRKRPIPSGRISANRAFVFGVGLSIVGFIELWLGANLLTALLGLFTLAEVIVLIWMAHAAEAGENCCAPRPTIGATFLEPWRLH